MSYEKSINLLKAKGVEFEAGLTDVEMGKIESTYKIEFPKSLKMFLMTVLPVSRGFYTKVMPLLFPGNSDCPIILLMTQESI